MREQWIGGDVTPAWRLTIHQEALAWDLATPYSTYGDVAEADSFHDWGGQRVLWGDVAQDGAGTILRLWNPKLWNDAAAWLYAEDDDDTVAAITGGPTMGIRSRPGLVGAALGWHLFVVASDGLLYRYPISDAYAFGTPSAGGALTDADGQVLGYDAVVVMPGAADEVLVAGLKNGILWLCPFRLSAGVWSVGRAARLIHDTALTWVDCAGMDAERLGDGSYVLTLPWGNDGRNMTSRYLFESAALNSGYVTTPHFILASPQEDMGRRIWVNALSQNNGRVWATCWNQVEGDPGRFYAGHAILMSSADGIAWEDHGLISQTDVRGKLLQVGDEVWIASPTSVLKAPATHRFATPDTSLSWEANGFKRLALSNGGQRQTAELRIGVQRGWQTAVVPGMAIEYELGAITGYDESGDPITELLPQFYGFIDRPELKLALGIADEQWLARGSLGRMIGEAAYRPPTALWFPGRRTFETTFLEQDQPVAALAAISGSWIAELVEAAAPTPDYAHLVCYGSGFAAVPVLWEWPDLIFTADFDTPRTIGLVLWNAADDAEFDQDYLLAEVDGTSYRLRSVVDGVSSTLYSGTITNHVAGARLRLTACLRSADLRVTAEAADGTVTTYDHSSLWSLSGSALAAPAARWRCGVYADVNMVTFAGSGVDDLTANVPIQTPPEEEQREALTYTIKITATGATADRFDWGWTQPGGSIQWQATGVEVMNFAHYLDNDVSVTFASRTGHAVDAQWTFPYPQPEAHVYAVMCAGGDDPVTVRDALTTCAGVTGVTTELDASVSHATGVDFVMDYLDVEMDVAAAGDLLQIYAEDWVLEAKSNGFAFRDHTIYCGTLSYPITVRVVLNEGVLSVHHGGHVLAAWRDVEGRSGPFTALNGNVALERPLAWPVDELWWDYDQPASSVLERVLDRRRVYMYEDGDGVVRITTAFERDTLIGPSDPVDVYTSYQRAVVKEDAFRDVRDVVGLVQVIGDGSEGSRVAMLDPEAAQYGVRSITRDNPWVRTEVDAQAEALRILKDYRRRLEQWEVQGFWDPAMRLGDKFTVTDTNGVTWTGIVQSYQHELGINDGRAVHTAEWAAVAALVESDYGLWVLNELYPDEGEGNMPDGPEIPAPPQITEGAAKWNQAKWK